MLIIRNLKKYIGIFLFDFNATIFALFFSFLALSLFRLPVSVTDIQIALPLLIVSQFIMNVALGLYEDSLRESYSGLFKRAFLSNAIASPMAVSFVLFLDVGLARIADVSFLFIAVFLISVITLQSSWRYFVFDKGWGRTEKRKILVVGAGDRAAFLTRRMRRQSDRRSFNLIGFYPLFNKRSNSGKLDLILEDDVKKHEHVYLDGIYDVNTSSHLSQIIDKEQPDMILLANSRSEKLPSSILLSYKMSGVSIIELEDFIEHELGQIAVEHLKTEWLLTSNGFNLKRPWFDFFQYLLNAFMALTLLLIVWPIMAVTAVLIYLDDGKRDNASVLYQQVRTGRYGKPFWVYKFRSMGKFAESNGAQWAQKNDSRVTRIGQVIRKYRIDELPQLFNVIKGDMFFVGPRPERPEFVQTLSEKIPYFNYRHSVKPGLTGWAQVNYSYGASEQDSHEKLKFDLYYIKHRSFLLDFYILFRTVEVVLYGRGR